MVREARAGAVAEVRDLLKKLDGEAAAVLIGSPEHDEAADTADVVIAAHGELPVPGKIYTAPQGKRLSMRGSSIVLSENAEDQDDDPFPLQEILEKCDGPGIMLTNREYRVVWRNEKFAQHHLSEIGTELRKGDSILPNEEGELREATKQRYDFVFSGKEHTEKIRQDAAQGKGPAYTMHYKPVYDGEGRCCGAAVTMTETTGGKGSETAPGRGERLYRKLFENGGEAAAVLGPDGRPRFVSESVKQVLGYTVEEALRLELFEALHPEDTEKAKKVIEEALANPGVTLKGGVLRMRVKSGRYRYFDAKITNMLHDPDVRGIVDNFRDVTEIVEASGETAFERRNREALINNTEDLIWSIDKNYCLVAANDAMKATMQVVTGKELRTGDDLLDKAIFTEDQRTYWRALYDRSLSGETVKVNTSGMDGDKESAVVYDAVLTPIKHAEAVVGVACYAHDVSERKRREKLLKERTEFIETTVNNLPIGIAVNETGSGVTTLMNERFTDIYGWPREALSGVDRFFKNVYPDEARRKEIKSRVLADIASGDIKRMVWRGVKITTSSGEQRYINAQNIPLPEQGLMISTVLDVTDEYTSNRVLKETNDRYELLMKSSFETTWDYDVRTGLIYWGAGMESNFGHRFNDAVSSVDGWADLVHPADRDKAVSDFKKAVSDGKSQRWAGDYRMVKSDGSYAEVRDRGYILRDHEGHAIRVVGAVQDFTAEKVYKRNLQRLNSELQKRAEELAVSNADLEQFAYVASHDLQEPLRMITGFLTQIEKKYAPLLDDRGRQYINFATDGAARMRQIILDLLEYSRVGRTEASAQVTDMNACLEEAEKILAGSIRESGALITSADLPRIKAVPGEIRQMFQNLLANAIKYSKEGEAPRIEIGAKELPDHFEFSVKDNGIGIDPIYFDKIFSVFQRLHLQSEYSGTGIGLAICKRIAEKHGGRIYVQSEEGSGSTFCFTVSKNL